MSAKCSFDFVTPLFLGVDVSPEGEVVVICSLGMKVEAELLLAHFGLYVAHIFGSVVWEFGKPSHSNTNLSWTATSTVQSRIVPSRSTTLPLTQTKASIWNLPSAVLLMICW